MLIKDSNPASPIEMPKKKKMLRTTKCLSNLPLVNEKSQLRPWPPGFWVTLTLSHRFTPMLTHI